MLSNPVAALGTGTPVCATGSDSPLASPSGGANRWSFFSCLSPPPSCGRGVRPPSGGDISCLMSPLVSTDCTTLFVSSSAPPPTHPTITPENAIHTSRVRSEEHTSELQSRLHLVC